MWNYALMFLIFLILGYVVSLIREALLEISRGRVEEFEKAFKKVKAKRLRRLLKHPSEVVAAIIIVRMAVLFGLFWVAYKLSLLLSNYDRVIFIVLFVFVLIVCVEFLPQIIGYRRNFAVVKDFLFFIEIVSYSLNPFVKFLKFVTNFLLRLFGMKGFKSLQYIDEEELELLLEDTPRYRKIEEMEKEMITGIIAFRETVVREVMVPRINMICIPVETTINEALDVILKSGHSRIPVFKERIDNIVGILYAKDILGTIKDSGKKEDSVTKIMRKPIFVPETKKLNELLLEFKDKKAHIAIVVDEYGGTSGLVTIEDLLEEIVGEIEDEFDKAEKKKYKKIKEGIIESDAQVDIDKLNEEFDLNLPTDETYESIGGLIIEKLGYVPKAGEKIEIGDFEFEILNADEKHIKKVKIIIKNRTEEE